jgi:predicted transcriptional regulator
MKYRSRTEIVATMLQSATDGATKTKLMYKAYLSYSQLKEYLRYLEENELIKYEEGTQLYRVTPKGHQFLHIHEEINDLVTPSSAYAKLKTIEF